MAAHLEYHAPEEIMHRFPQVKKFGWNSSKIGIFFHSGLLIGYFCGKEKKALVLESSFQELIEFTNGIFLKHRVSSYPLDSETDDSNSYTSIEELLSLYPQVEYLTWTAPKIGIFFSSGLLIGYHCGKEKKAMILESSFIGLIEFTNTVMLKRQVFIYPKNL